MIPPRVVQGVRVPALLYGSSEQHMREDLSVHDFELGPEDMRAIEGLVA